MTFLYLILLLALAFFSFKLGQLEERIAWNALIQDELLPKPKGKK